MLVTFFLFYAMSVSPPSRRTVSFGLRHWEPLGVRL
jgi:hypothetical protein